MSRTWFITGASRGIGRAICHAALARGELVAAAARDVSELEGDGLLPLRLDVTDRDAVFAAVRTAVEAFGRLDVVANNAGTLSVGMVEEFGEAEARAALETNFFGALWVSQAVTPQLREQGSGHLIQMSSIAALGGFPSTGLYSASKFALEGMSEALAAELATFGAKLTIVEPGGYWTDLYTRMRTMAPIAAYTPLREELARQMAEGSVDSDPSLAARAVLELADSEDPPLRLLLGSMVFDLALDRTRAKLDTWAGWEGVSRAAERAIPMPTP